MTYRCTGSIQLNAIIPDYSIPINPRISLNQTHYPKIIQQND